MSSPLPPTSVFKLQAGSKGKFTGPSFSPPTYQSLQVISFQNSFNSIAAVCCGDSCNWLLLQKLALKVCVSFFVVVFFCQALHSWATVVFSIIHCHSICGLQMFSISRGDCQHTSRPSIRCIKMSRISDPWTSPQRSVQYTKDAGSGINKRVLWLPHQTSNAECCLSKHFWGHISFHCLSFSKGLSCLKVASPIYHLLNLIACKN